MLRRQFMAACFGAALIALSSGASAADKTDWKEPFPVKGKVTVVDFGAPWCAGCPETEQVMKDLQKEYGDKAAFIVINIDEYRGIEDKYLIETMPSQIAAALSGGAMPHRTHSALPSSVYTFSSLE